jgi:hypothetical protein
MLRCCYTVVALLVHYFYNVVTISLHCSHLMGVLLVSVVSPCVAYAVVHLVPSKGRSMVVMVVVVESIYVLQGFLGVQLAIQNPITHQWTGFRSITCDTVVGCVVDSSCRLSIGEYPTQQRAESRQHKANKREQTAGSRPQTTEGGKAHFFTDGKRLANRSVCRYSASSRGLCM